MPFQPRPLPNALSLTIPGLKGVRVRMGLHTGEPDLASEGYVGLSVHHAARMMSAGHGGQVLLSQVTCDLVEHNLPERVSLRDLGAHRLKDLRHPHHLFQLVIAGLTADFPPLKTLDTSPHNLLIQPNLFIGREKDVAAVQHNLLREGVRLLTLTGSGGVGDFWDLRGLNSEWWEFLQQALVGSEGVAASVRAKTLSVAANYAMSRGAALIEQRHSARKAWPCTVKRKITLASHPALYSSP